MLDQLIYREGTISDVDQLQRLGILSYSQFQSVLSSENWEKFNGNLQDRQKFTDILKIAKCYVCTLKNEIIGVAYIIPSGNPTDLFQSDWSYIRMVGVNPKYQGKGVAKRLTSMCIDFAKQNNEKIIALHTSEFMDAARHIYESLGFKKLKEIAPHFGKKYWLYTYNIEP
jgi:ribosomal protein S18 acetylase RimI-like enzyme